MKVLLDENLPHDLRHFLPGHEVATVTFRGWNGIGNGRLLALAAANGFQVMISKDAGIEYEQNLTELPIAVLLVRAPTNALQHIQPVIPALLDALSSVKPRSVVRVG